jgi:hypothetical protein
MRTIFIPAVHLPHGAELFRTLPYRRSEYKRILKLYSERALLQCSPDDVIFLPEMPDEGYLEFLVGQGIGTKNIFVCNGSGDNFAEDILNDHDLLGKIKELSPADIRFYIHLEEEESIASKISAEVGLTHPSLTRMFNTMYFLIRIEEDLALESIPREQVRASRLEAPLRRLLETEKGVFVRGNESCGGSQAFLLRSEEDLAGMIKKVSRNQIITRYFASRFIEGAQGWNYQFSLDGDGCYKFLGASRQLLRDGYAHEGNDCGLPPNEKGMEVSVKLAARISEIGGRGVMGADIVIDGGKAFAAELNMRENTSTPVLTVKQKFDIPFFRTLKMRAPKGMTFPRLMELVGAENLFNSQRKSGILPYNLAASRFTGALDMAVFANNEEELKNRLEQMATLMF